MAIGASEDVKAKDRYQLQFSEDLNQKIDIAVSNGSFISKAEFIRAAVREKLERMGVL